MSDAVAARRRRASRRRGPVGASPWALARRRLLRNRVAMAMLGVLAA